MSSALMASLGTVCGTPEGWLLHRSQHDLPCGDCAYAWSISPGIAPVAREVCGTNDGWMAHRRRKEWPCPRCAAAREVHEADLCGSEAGWMLHRRAGTTACGRCKAFIHRRNSERRTARRERRRAPLVRIPEAGSNPTGALRRAHRDGAVLVCALPQYRGAPVCYAPRWDIDSKPWALVWNPAVHLSARDCRAVGLRPGTTAPDRQSGAP